MKCCEEYAALLDAWIDGECSAEEAARVREHLKTCAGCRDYVQAALAMRDAFPDWEETPVPEAFSSGVMSAIRSGTVPRKKRKAPWGRVLVSLAACCAIMVLVRFGPFGGLGGSAGNNIMDARVASDSSAVSDTVPTPDGYDSDTAGGSSAAKSPSDGGAAASSPATEEKSGLAAARSLPDSGTANSSPITEEAPGSSAAKSPSDSSPAASSPATEKTPDSSADSVPDDGATTTSPSVEGPLLTIAGTPPSDDGAAESSSSDAGSASPILLQPGDLEQLQAAYLKWAALTAEETGTALDGSVSTALYDDGTGEIITAYELSEAEFDDIIAQLESDAKVTVNDAAGTDLCCILVYS